MTATIDRGVLNKFNRGEVSEAAFAREEVDRLQNSSETMINFTPERLGPMSYRCGSELLLEDIDDESVFAPFFTSFDDPVFLIISNALTPTIRIVRDDAFIARSSVTSSMQNQSFATGFAAGEWVDIDESGATSTISGGALLQTGATSTSPAFAKVYQTLDSTETGEPHAFSIRVTKGSITLKLGTGGQESADLFEGLLNVGLHNIEVTPDAALTVTIMNDSPIQSKVNYCSLISVTTAITFNIETALDITVPSTNTLSTLRKLQSAESANILYFAGPGFKPFQVIRWSPTSFSVERYVNKFGPWERINTSAITMTPNGLSGDVQITASNDFFEQTADFDYDKGTLIKLATPGQQTEYVTGDDTSDVTDSIFISGTGDGRIINWGLSFNNNANDMDVDLQRSFDDTTWTTVKTTTISAGLVGNTNSEYNDEFINVETYYRSKVASVVAGDGCVMNLSSSFGTFEGEGHIEEVISSTVVQAEIHNKISDTTSVRNWYIGSWGGKGDYPTAIALYESRLWFGGTRKINGSETDFYESHDRSVEGASAAIERTMAFGGSDEILWLAPSARLVAGTSQLEIDIKSSSFNEVITDLNAHLKPGSNLGCSPVLPIVLDQEIIFVQNGGNKLVGISFDISQEKHEVEDFNMLNTTILDEEVVSIAYSRNPETRIYCVMADGTMRVLLRDKSEDVIGWSRLTTAPGENSREILDVLVMPAAGADRVYIMVKDSTTDNVTLEKFALPSECVGGNVSKHFDMFTKLTSPGTSFVVPGTVDGTTVAVWVDGVDDGDYVTSTQTISGVTSGTDVVVGLRYTGTYKSNKLGSHTGSSVLTANKRIINTGLIMKDYLLNSITVGPDASSLSALPAIEKGKAATSESSYDFLPFEFDGESETDPRIHLSATGPCNIMALTYEVKDTDRKSRKA